MQRMAAWSVFWSITYWRSMRLIDKSKAKRRAWRIPEKTIFAAALLGGGPGVWLGMYWFRHKTRHWYFVVGIPLITLAEYGLLAWRLLGRP